MFLESHVAKRGNKYFNKVKKLNMRMVVLKNATNALMQPLGMVLVIGIFAYFYKMSAEAEQSDRRFSAVKKMLMVK